MGGKPSRSLASINPSNLCSVCCKLCKHVRRCSYKNRSRLPYQALAESIKNTLEVNKRHSCIRVPTLGHGALVTDPGRRKELHCDWNSDNSLCVRSSGVCKRKSCLCPSQEKLEISVASLIKLQTIAESALRFAKTFSRG